MLIYVLRMLPVWSDNTDVFPASWRLLRENYVKPYQKAKDFKMDWLCM